MPLRRLGRAAALPPGVSVTFSQWLSHRALGPRVAPIHTFSLTGRSPVGTTKATGRWRGVTEGRVQYPPFFFV
jgi:hypothetical protein